MGLLIRICFIKRMMGLLIRICFIKRVFLMCSLSYLRKTVQFINSFVELILAICDHDHDPTSSPACSSNVVALFQLAPTHLPSKRFSWPRQLLNLGFLAVWLDFFLY